MILSLVGVQDLKELLVRDGAPEGESLPADVKVTPWCASDVGALQTKVCLQSDVKHIMGNVLDALPELAADKLSLLRPERLSNKAKASPVARAAAVEAYDKQARVLRQLRNRKALAKQKRCGCVNRFPVWCVLRRTVCTI